MEGNKNNIESFVFYRNDYESLCELNLEDRKEIVYAILMKVFENKQLSIKPQNKAVSKVISDKIILSAKNYFKLKNGGSAYER